MNRSRDNPLADVFQHIPMLKEYHPEDFRITDLESYTNKNYHLKNKSLDLILRLPRQQTNIYIDRQAEASNEKIAFKLGLSPACLWHNDKGESLTQTVTHSKPVTATELRQSDTLHLVAKGLRLLHRSSQQFQGQVNLQQLLQRYFLLLNRQQQQTYRDRFNQAQTSLHSLQSEPVELVPSHNDLNQNNLLLDEQHKLWFIDWEYSSMASPYWDLATICNAGEYQQQHCQLLLQLYNSQQHPLELHKLLQYREILAVLNDCWMAVFCDQE